MSIVLPILFMAAGVGMFSKKITPGNRIFMAFWILLILLKELFKTA